MKKDKKLLDLVVDKIRVKHYSIKTEQSYTSWIKKYILFHNKRHPKDMGKYEIEAYLTYLAVTRNVSPTTQNQAFNAILFLYEQVLNISLKDANIQSLRILKILILDMTKFMYLIVRVKKIEWYHFLYLLYKPIDNIVNYKEFLEETTNDKIIQEKIKTGKSCGDNSFYDKIKLL